MKFPKIFKFSKCKDLDVLRVPESVVFSDDGALPEDISREPALHVARRAIHSEANCLMSEVMVGKMYGTQLGYNASDPLRTGDNNVYIGGMIGKTHRTENTGPG